RASVAQGSIGIDAPFPFHFRGSMAALDLRRVPSSIPVPRVESNLALNYDVTGRFEKAFLKGRAEFAPSTFLGASVGAGTIGAIDTSATPIAYTGDGVINGVQVRRFGEGLDVAWMRDPRYAGTISGQFHVEGVGSDRTQLVLTAGGHISRGELFRGTISD